MKNFSLLFFLFIFVTNPAYPQDTIYVPGDYSTIQAGIDAASVGNIVLVAEDTYYENINFKGKAITVASYFIRDEDTSHISNTIIDGSQPAHPDTGAVVNFVNQEDTTSVLCGFTITGGTGTHHHIYNNRLGGGIILVEAGGRVSNNIIEYNTLIDDGTATGGGIFVGSIITPPLYNCIIEDNIIRYNSVDGGWNSSAGGISTQLYGNVWIIDNQITNNVVYEGGMGYNTVGGGLLLYNWDSTSNYWVLDNIITNNMVEPLTDGYGGGVIAFNCDAMLTNNIIVNNSAPEGGGISCVENSNLTITDATIENNIATSGSGGGIACWESSLSLINVTINGNTSNFGGGILAENSDVQIDSCNFISNEALGGSGGGISAVDCDLQIENCSFTENEATNGRGGAIFFKADTTYSGLPYQVTIYNTSFQENTADKGGGVNINNWGYFPLIIDVTIDNCEFNSNKALGGNGGGLSSVNSNVTITDCDFNGNQANDGSGGGVFVADYDSLLVIDVLIDNCEFINNAADNYAGLRIKGYVFTLSNSVFTGNTAVRYTAGGGFTAGSSGTVSNCLFASNIANTGGENWNSGGTSVWTESNVNFINCTFANNSAAYGTGLTVGGGGIATTTNCIFWGNSTDQLALDTLYGAGGTLTVNYCDVQDGEDSVNVIDPLLSTLNWEDGNIDADPLFVDPLISDYHLQDTSPCIGTAIDTIVINGIMCYCPPFDIEGNPRPDPVGSMPDIGAYESPFPVGVEDDLLIIPEVYSLAQNYPNPFNPSTTIKYSIPELSFVTLKVYDVLGSEVAIIVNEEKSIGSYNVKFDATGLPSGIYFYRLQTSDFVETKKMVLMK